MNIFRFAGFAAAAALVFASSASAATPEKEAAGWANWVAFNQGILDADEVGTLAPMNDACKGAMGMVVSQGFAFPRWAQQTMLLCRGLGYIARNDRKDACKTLKGVSKELGKAKPVAIEPRAEPMAGRLKAIADRGILANRC